LSAGSCVPYRVGLVLIDDFALLSYASLTEPLRVANLLSGRELYRVSVLPTSGALATSSGGVLVPATAQIGDPIDLDLVIVVAAGNPFSFKDERVLSWLRQLARRDVALGGVSGGPVVLAEAGLMAGYRMTLHWEHAPALHQRHPELVIERSLYVIDRERLSCAGGTAPLDLMHALLMRDQGVILARQVSDWLQHTEIRPPGGAQRAGVVERYGVHLSPLIEALGAMETHVSDPLSLQDLAQIANVGVRQLTRLFREKLDTTPMALYRKLRLEQGHRLLCHTDLCVGEVARATGFASAAHFTSAYGSQYDLSPRQSRNRDQNLA
jgi:transcriptional regulator GlxA family with amidase domain